MQYKISKLFSPKVIIVLSDEEIDVIGFDIVHLRNVTFESKFSHGQTKNIMHDNNNHTHTHHTNKFFLL